MVAVIRRLTIWLSILMPLAVISAAFTAPVPPALNAESAILVDAITGKVLYEKRCRERRPPASTTKVMTAILALENGDLNSPVRASVGACKTPFSSLHLKPGESLPLRDLLYGLLLRSANDAAVCVAEHISGSEREFVAAMNRKAKEIGAKDTHFTNSHGLHDPKHYSTTYDLALIARYAIRIPMFNEIVRTKTAEIERSINSKDAFMKNTARFLWKFDGADGIKTGYTRQAGRCFVGSATRDGRRLVAVVLKSKDAGADTAMLMRYGFKYFKQVSFARSNEIVTTAPVKGGVERVVKLAAEKDLSLVLRDYAKAETRVDLDIKKISAPVSKGEKLGTLTGYLNGERIGSVDLVAASPVGRTVAASIWTWTRSTLTASFILLVGFLTYGTAAAKAARRRRRRVAARC